MNLVACVGCGGLFPDVEGSTHRYMESSPGCWLMYGEVLAREYSDPAYGEVNRLSVDAYAVQHPGQPSPQSIQSVALHLIRLCLLLERGLEIERANEAMIKAVEARSKFIWLTPPTKRGILTVADVHRAGNAQEHLRLVREWAESAWTAWSPHYAQIRAWLPSGFVAHR